MRNPTPAQTRKTISRLLATGHTPRAIALKLGITTQAVYLHMDELKAEAARKKEEAS